MPLERTRLKWGVVPPPARSRDAIVIGAAGAIAFLAGALVWPLYPGRDAQTYLMYYLEMGRGDPLFPVLMLFRTPGAPLFFGPPLAMGAPLVPEVMLGVCYVVTLLAVYLTGCFWSRRIGLVAAIVVAVYPGYNSLFHQLSSDGLFSFAFALWTLCFCAAQREPTIRKFAGLGAFVFVLTMIRPASLLFFVFLGLLVLVTREPLRYRMIHGAVAFATAATLIAAWAGYNAFRYGDFTVSRLTPANMPFFRLFAMDHLIAPENGPASRELANAIEQDLLSREPYRSYGVSLDYFLKHGFRLMWSDLAPMSDRVWGWDSDYEVLRSASREAIARHPLRYASGVASTSMKFLTVREYHVPAPWPPARRSIRCEVQCMGEGSVVRNGRVLPSPPYPDETIPLAHSYWLESTPDSGMATDWSDFANPRLTFKSAERQREFTELSTRLGDMMIQLPSRPPMDSLIGVANLAAHLFPSMWVWLLLGAAGLFRIRTDRALALCFPAMALIVTVVNSLGLPPTSAYRLPFDPLLILFGVAGFIGTRIDPRIFHMYTKDPDPDPVIAQRMRG